MLKGNRVGVLFSVLLLGLTACNKEVPQEQFLAPLAGLASAAITEIDERIDKAASLLKEDVAVLPQIARHLGGDAEAEDTPVDWGGTPYMAVAVSDADGKPLVVFPRAADAFTELLVAAANGPDIGDLTIVPNTFTFTVGLSHRPEGTDNRLSALIEVDRILLKEVLLPTAGSAGGYAFLANGDQRVIMTTLPSLMGQDTDKWSMPVAVAGQAAVGEITVSGRVYYVATAKSPSANGWMAGVLVPVASANTEDAPKAN
jgi:hypothetical protein